MSFEKYREGLVPRKMVAHPERRVWPLTTAFDRREPRASGATR